MFVWIARWFLNALALYIVSQIVPGIHVANFTAALIAVVVIGLANTLVKPILFILTLPITLVTFGLFSLVLNALMLLLAGSVLSGFSVEGFGAAFIGSILLSLVSTLFQALVK